MGTISTSLRHFGHFPVISSEGMNFVFINRHSGAGRNPDL